MIISSGYNIAAIEVESVLLTHEDILECAVVGLPDKERGMLVCAHIVLKDNHKASNELAKSHTTGSKKSLLHINIRELFILWTICPKQKLEKHNDLN